ncbi:MAG: porin family protein [Verrucomicrobiales bacterium]|nr:porin family protein [Verrucomicrobiales bacterium]
MTALLAGGAVLVAQAEDADRLRPYIQFRSAEFNTAWDVLDGIGLGAGVNLNRYWGIEFAADFYEMELLDRTDTSVGEEGIWHFVPQARFRYPMLKDRLVPYLIAGIGPNRMEYNDRTQAGFGRDIDANGGSFSVALGGGIEYFLADNITFGIEGKYMWSDPVDVSIDGQRQELDMSAPLVTMGLRVYLDENHPQPKADSLADVPARLYAGVRIGVGVMPDGNWVPGVKLEPEVSSWGPFNQIFGLSLGANFGRHLGVELTGESMEWAIHYGARGSIGEYAFVPVIPHLRFRLPLERGRVVPFVMAGFGAAYGEFNDLKPAGQGIPVDASGFYPALGVGGGIEYFFTRQASVSLEARWNYSWGHEITLDGLAQSGDISNVQAQIGIRLYLLEL